MKYITGLENIRKAQTVPYPGSDFIRARRYDLHIQDGGEFIHGFYNRKRGEWEIGAHETKESAIAFFEELRTISEMAPEVINWADYSEMVIWGKNGHDPRTHASRWALAGIVVED